MDRLRGRSGSSAGGGPTADPRGTPGKRTLVEQLYRKAIGPAGVPAHSKDAGSPADTVMAARASSGAPVDASVRGKVEAATGSDLSGVYRLALDAADRLAIGSAVRVERAPIGMRRQQCSCLSPAAMVVPFPSSVRRWERERPNDHRSG